MAFVENRVDNAVEQYQELLQQIDQNIVDTRTQLEQTSSPDDHKKLLEKTDDLVAVRKQLVDHVKEKGISGPILEQTRRYLSVF